MYRSVVAVAVVATAASLLGGAPSAAGSPPGAVTVTPAVAGAVHDVVVPLAGAPHWLIFQQSAHVLGVSNDVNIVPVNDVEVPDDPATRVIRARGANGKTITVTKKRSTDLSWSISTGVVTAERAYVPGRSRTRVDWWNLPRHTHGTIRLKPGQGYLSAAPGGFMFSSKTGGVRRMTISTGKIRSYGRLRREVGQAVSGPKGVVVGSRGVTFHYLRFARPHHFVRLATRTTDGVPGRCAAINAHYATCYDFFDGDDAAAPRHDLLVPLNGGKPTVAKHCAGVPAVSGHTMIWAQPTGPATGACATLRSRAAGASSDTTSTAPGFGPGTTAYGKAIFVTDDGGTLIAATSATTSTTILTAPRSPATVGSFALSTGRVTDTDDQVVSGSPAQVEVATRAVPSNGHTASVESNTDLTSAEPLAVDARAVAASGANTAYLVTDPATDQLDLRVVTPGGTRTFSKVAPFDITLSGDHVMYEADTKDGLHHVHLADLVTGKNRDLGHPIGEENGQEHALWGNYLTYTTATKMVREDLTTGTTATVTSFGPDSTKKLLGEYGDHVVVLTRSGAVSYDPRTGTRTKVHAGLGAYSGPTVNSAGVLYLTNHGKDFSLESWDGTSHQLLVTAAVGNADAPQVDGQTMAWIDASHRLELAPLDLAIQRPWSLGDPIAPSALIADGSHSWSAGVPYSTELSSCTITITAGSTTVRTLPCGPADMALGVATATWDGRDGSDALAAPGTYTWTVDAANSAGTALSPSGDSSPMTGTISVTAD